MYTGHMFEYDVLKEGTQLITSAEAKKYKPYNVAMQEVIKLVDNSNWDTEDPNSDIANDLHANVALSLGIDDWSELKFYPAIGTSFDYHHGVDCFFKYKGNVATVDLTLNASKDSYKADVVVTPDMLEGKMSEAVSEICVALN